MIACPNCGYQQESGNKCEKCSSLFAYYAETSGRLTDGGTLYSPRVSDGKQQHELQELTPEHGAFDGVRTFFRRARWVALAVFVVIFMLILKKGAPPRVSVDPNAAARAEEKIRVSEAQSSVGEPHQLQLDNVELNSYLNQNLAINGRTEPASAPAAPQLSPAVAAPGAAMAPGAAIAPEGAPAAAPAAAPSLEDIQSAVKDVKVDMQGDLVKAYVVYNYHGADLSLELDGHLRAENGYLKFEPVSGSLGSLPLPTSVLQSAAQHLFDSPENREKLKLPPDVTDIQIVDGQVVASYK